MKEESRWDIHFVEKCRGGKKAAEMATIFLLAYLGSIKREDPDAFQFLKNIIAKVEEDD